MTVTVVYGKADDGYLSSSNANYTTARNGSGVALTGGGTLLVGQRFASSTYYHHQGFIGFDYVMPGPDEVVTAAAVLVQVSGVASPATTRALELRSYTWSSGAGFGSGDWRNSTQLSDAVLRAVVQGVQSATSGKYLLMGSDELLTAVAGASSLEFVLATDRQRAGTVPTLDETLSVVSADASGTGQDPVLVFTTVPRSTLFGNLGAQARLSDGTSVSLEGTGDAVSPALQLTWWNHAGTSSTDLGSPLTIGTGSTAFALGGLQALAVAVGPDDSVYVVGRAGNAENSLRVQTWTHNPGGGPEDHSWTPAALQTVAMPTHDAAINNIAACVVASGGLESLVIMAAHTVGTAMSGGNAGDVGYAVLNTAALRGLGGTVTRTVGSALDALFPTFTTATDFNGFYNPVGAGLDVVADPDNPGWFYATSFRRDQDLGGNDPLFLARGILNGTHVGLSLASPTVNLGFGVKDAAAKVRVVPCGAGVAALLTADADSGYGLSLDVQQHFGSDPGSVNLGFATLAQEDIPSMPDGPAVGTSHAWDVIHNATDNALWIYYVDAADPARLMRTGFSLAAYQATREEREVLTVAAGGTITGVRVARNGSSGDRTRVYVAWTGSGGGLSLESVTDSFNIAPTAPTLSTRDGVDATLPADLSWTFNDPNSWDAQTAFHLQVEDQDTATLALDTGKTLSASTTYTVPGGTLVNPETYRWRVRTWDVEDLESPWSAWGVFQTSAGGSVEVTAPAVDNAPGINTDDYAVQWAATGTVQAAYRVRLYRTSTEALVSDSGWVASTATSRAVAGMASDVEYRVEVQVRNAVGVVSNPGTRLITPSYGTPEPPVLTVTPTPEQGYTLLQVQNPPPGGDRPDVAYNLLMRRRTGSADPWEILGQCLPGGEFRDYTATAKAVYSYRARGVTA